MRSAVTRVAMDETAIRVTIFLSEDDRLHHHGLHEVIVARAHEEGVLGATVWRGIEGFGPNGHLRTSRFPDANTGLPLVVEFIDEPSRVDKLLAILAELAPDSLVTTESVHVIRNPARP